MTTNFGVISGIRAVIARDLVNDQEDEAFIKKCTPLWNLVPICVEYIRSDLEKSGDENQKSGNLNEAIETYSLALKILEKVNQSSHFGPFFYKRGKAYAKQGKFEEAVADYQKALTHLPSNHSKVQSVHNHMRYLKLTMLVYRGFF